jgi:hypothetical protein
MDRETAQAEIYAIILAIIFLVISRFLLFPAVCQSFPLQIPGQEFDYCFFFR